MTPEKTEAALDEAIAYLEENGFDVPWFDVEFTDRVGGSMVFDDGSMRLGVYPGQRRRNWFVMHELIHELVWYHEVELPEPFDADPVVEDPGWAVRACMNAGRPPSYASIYSELGGGEEFLCELFAMMYVKRKGFDAKPPLDLEKAWEVAWELSAAME